MKRNKYINSLLDRLPATGSGVAGRNFLTIDTYGRIIIEDCNKVNSFTSDLLVVTQGRLTLTFTGKNLRLVNLSKRGTRLVGTVQSVRLERHEVK